VNAGPRVRGRGRYEAALLNTPVADPTGAEILRTIHSFTLYRVPRCNVIDAQGREYVIPRVGRTKGAAM